MESKQLVIQFSVRQQNKIKLHGDDFIDIIVLLFFSGDNFIDIIHYHSFHFHLWYIYMQYLF